MNVWAVRRIGEAAVLAAMVYLGITVLLIVADAGIRWLIVLSPTLSLGLFGLYCMLGEPPQRPKAEAENYREAQP